MNKMTIRKSGGVEWQLWLDNLILYSHYGATAERMEKIAKRYNFFEQHGGLAEVERKLEALEDLPKLWTGALFEWMGSLTRSGVKDEIEKCLQKCKPDTIDPPHPTVGDLKPGDFAVFITANDFWEGIKFSINRRKNTADGNNVSIYPLNGKCTAIQVSKLTPCKIVEG